MSQLCSVVSEVKSYACADTYLVELKDSYSTILFSRWNLNGLRNRSFYLPNKCLNLEGYSPIQLSDGDLSTTSESGAICKPELIMKPVPYSGRS